MFVLILKKSIFLQYIVKIFIIFSPKDKTDKMLTFSMYNYMFNIQLAKGHRSSTALFTKPLDSLLPAGMLSRDWAPIHTQWDIFQWNGGIVPGKVASGFVNSTVTSLFTKPVASWFPAVP